MRGGVARQGGWHRPVLGPPAGPAIGKKKTQIHRCGRGALRVWSVAGLQKRCWARGSAGWWGVDAAKNENGGRSRRFRQGAAAAMRTTTAAGHPRAPPTPTRHRTRLRGGGGGRRSRGGGCPSNPPPVTPSTVGRRLRFAVRGARSSGAAAAARGAGGPQPNWAREDPPPNGLVGASTVLYRHRRRLSCQRPLPRGRLPTRAGAPPHPPFLFSAPLSSLLPSPARVPVAGDPHVPPAPASAPVVMDTRCTHHLRAGVRLCHPSSRLRPRARATAQ